MSDITCIEANETILEYEDAHIVVYGICGEKHRIPIQWIFEEILRGKGKGLLIMRDVVDKNKCIFG